MITRNFWSNKMGRYTKSTRTWLTRLQEIFFFDSRSFLVISYIQIIISSCKTHINICWACQFILNLCWASWRYMNFKSSQLRPRHFDTCSNRNSALIYLFSIWIDMTFFHWLPLSTVYYIYGMMLHDSASKISIFPPWVDYFYILICTELDFGNLEKDKL